MSKKKEPEPTPTPESKKEPTHFNKVIGRKTRRDKPVAVVMTEAAAGVADTLRRKGTNNRLKGCITKVYPDE